MESEKEFKDELKQSLPLYKIAGIVIAGLLILGIIVALITELKAPAPKPVPVPEPTPVQNITAPNLTQNITENLTVNISNITNTTISNITQNANNMTVNITPTPQPTQAPVNLNWSTIVINFPGKLKKIPSNATTHHYIEILEGDGTPVTNGEQFDMAFDIDDHYGRRTQVLPTFEANKWLISLLLPNTGNYTLILTLTCAEKKGHCHRFYSTGSVQKEFEFEVV